MSSESYFQSYEKYFWVWEKDGPQDIVSIPGGSTIAYQEFLRNVLEKIAIQGLPPFGSLLLAIVATNPDAANSLEEIRRILSPDMKSTESTILSEALNFLKLISEIPQQYRRGERRILLIQALFAQCHYILSFSNSRNICAYARSSGAANEKTTLLAPLPKNTFDRDFRTIGLLSKKFPSVQSILEKIASIPDASQYEIEFEKTESGDEPHTKDFIDELVDHPSTFTVGALVRRLWGGLSIPVHSSVPSQQPLGGVSDLTNKGDYDRLLISEFANDEIVFLSRLANNEALYLHREIPPADSRLRRIILIDASLKTWGTPKAIAFAIMLAIAKHPKTDIACDVYVLGEKNYYPVSFNTVHALIDALKIIEGGLHAGVSLALFLKDHAKDENKEILLITEASTPKHSAFLRVMNDNHKNIHYLFYTDADGNVDVYKKLQSSKKHIQHLKLDLQEAWKKPPVEPKRVTQRTEFAVNYPVLVRYPKERVKLLPVADGNLLMVSGKTILRYGADYNAGNASGWEIIYKNLGFTTDNCEAGITKNGEYVFLQYQSDRLVLINLSNGKKNEIPFRKWTSNAGPFIFEGDSFFLGEWQIKLDGTVVPSVALSSDIVERRRAIIRSVADEKFGTTVNVLRSIKGVNITSANIISLNGHQLKLSPKGDAIKWVSAAPTGFIKNAKMVNDDTFRFDDGSVVEVDKTGLVILKSSSDRIPHIYIPTTLNESLGIAVNDEFAGNLYYKRNAFRDIILVNAGSNPVVIVKYLMTNLKVGLRDAKLLVDNVPSTLPANANAVTLNGLNNLGATTMVKEPKENKKFLVDDFYEKYIRQYIEVIVNHGA